MESHVLNRNFMKDIMSLVMAGQFDNYDDH